ncbi:hypothetical protein CFN78_17670 [Amycolatopsis antarctica]|uniref:Secreted protein n=1 Tax=Amycolatopsis antarctica TaxID=1854586 RepID=A0A263D1J0_9PSEU|nr:hypothetical protein [Amycolatopsis antarctica]OZM71968.1 hypothetical protein CFN78_17670 [Amycolatopsis antarctica]
MKRILAGTAAVVAAIAIPLLGTSVAQADTGIAQSSPGDDGVWVLYLDQGYIGWSGVASFADADDCAGYGKDGEDEGWWYDFACFDISDGHEVPFDPGHR